MPWTSKYFQESTREELLVEFFEDFYDENPKEQIKDLKDEDGEITLETGDPIIDKWERELAMGLTPDLNEGLAPGEAKHIEKTLKENKKHTEVVEIDEKYDPTASIDHRRKMIKKLQNAGMLNNMPVLGND
jgi:hypothetical protein